MRREFSAWLAWMVLPLLAVAVHAAEPTVELKVVTDRPDAVYALGEQVRFVVSLEIDKQQADGAEVSYVMDKDGVPPTQKGTLKLIQGSATVEGTLNEPGFLLCRVTYRAADQKPITVLAGAGFDPLRIQPSLPVPDDFDAFWATQKARLAAVPMSATLTPVASTVDGIECFDVQVTCVPPKPVSGYFARPIGAAPQSLPALINLHGAGTSGATLAAATGFASKYHALSFDINAHGIANGQPSAFYKGLGDGELKGYRYFGSDDRENSYFLGMFLRELRAIDFLTSQPEWDGRILIARGSSQGGGQAIAAAGLDPRVSFVSAGVPAICDHSGKVIGRINGWPKLVPDKDGQPDSTILQVSRYFDCMNFATRAKADGIFSVGFIDVTCPPTSVYAAYNNYAGKKEMVTAPLRGHSDWPEFHQASAAAIAAHIKAVQSSTTAPALTNP